MHFAIGLQRLEIQGSRGRMGFRRSLLEGATEGCLETIVTSSISIPEPLVVAHWLSSFLKTEPFLFKSVIVKYFRHKILYGKRQTLI